MLELLACVCICVIDLLFMKIHVQVVTHIKESPPGASSSYMKIGN